MTEREKSIAHLIQSIRQRDREIRKLTVLKALLLILVVAVVSYQSWYLYSAIREQHTFGIVVGSVGLLWSVYPWVPESVRNRLRFSHASPVIRPPLNRLDRIARFLWSQRTYERVFAPLVADVAFEWSDAEARNRRWLVRWIRYVRAPYLMVSHMLRQIPVSMNRRD